VVLTIPCFARAKKVSLTTFPSKFPLRSTLLSGPERGRGVCGAGATKRKLTNNEDVLIQPPSLDQRHLVRHEAGRVHEAHQAGSAQAHQSAAVARARAVDGLDEAVLRAVQDQGYEERVGDGYEESERLTGVPDCVLSGGVIGFDVRYKSSHFIFLLGCWRGRKRRKSVPKLLPRASNHRSVRFGRGRT
jgi:hypothetical protein